MVDGVASMMTMFAGLLPTGRIAMERGRNLLAGAAPFYRCYECADGQYVAVGPLEPKFFAELIAQLGLPGSCHRRNMMRRDGRRLPNDWQQVSRRESVALGPRGLRAKIPASRPSSS